MAIAKEQPSKWYQWNLEIWKRRIPNVEKILIISSVMVAMRKGILKVIAQRIRLKSRKKGSPAIENGVMAAG